jgi:hypothetical protein
VSAARQRPIRWLQGLLLWEYDPVSVSVTPRPVRSKESCSSAARAYISCRTGPGRHGAGLCDGAGRCGAGGRGAHCRPGQPGRSSTGEPCGLPQAVQMTGSHLMPMQRSLTLTARHLRRCRSRTWRGRRAPTRRPCARWRSTPGSLSPPPCGALKPEGLADMLLIL